MIIPTRVILLMLLFSLAHLQCTRADKDGMDSADINSLVEENFDFAQKKITIFLEYLDFDAYPGTIDDQGQLVILEPRSWEAGYLAGILWQLFDYTKAEKWRVYAEQWTAGLELQKYNKNNHNLLFMLYSSFGDGYKITQDPLYEAVLIEGAKSVSCRYNPELKVIKSWDAFYESMTIQCPVIVDALMANEMLFYVAGISGDSGLYQIAYNHALNTKQDFFRPNNSTFYLVDYDTVFNKVKEKRTWLGESDSSTWARGHARAIYGSAITFRETGDSAFLEQAKQSADFWMQHPRLPDDLIPFWDFDDPDIPNAPRDASAACIFASGLLELSCLLPEKEGDIYYKFAIQTLKNLASDAYRNKPDENLGFILKHSTGSVSWNQSVDKPKIAADYYFIKSLLQLKEINDSRSQ